MDERKTAAPRLALMPVLLGAGGGGDNRGEGQFYGLGGTRERIGGRAPSVIDGANAAPGQSGGGSLYRPLGLEYSGGSVAGSTRRTYEYGGRWWRTFRPLMAYQDCLESSDSESSKAWAFTEFTLWWCL